MSYVYSELELRLRAECEQGFEVGPRTPAEDEAFVGYSGKPSTPWLSPTGEHFTELINPDKLRLADDETCYRVGLETFRRYAKGKAGTLYWRTYPEISRGRFYMRLLISDRPAMEGAQGRRQGPAAL